MISIVGYGSLLSEASARETIPGLTNFRIVTVPGYKRIFNKVGVVFISRHKADPDSLQLASCSTLPASDCEIICSQFDCTQEEYEALFEREHRFNWVEVETFTDGQSETGLMCTGSTDQHYRYSKCRSEQEYHERVGQFYAGNLWRNDILPFPRYLSFCLKAAASQGEAVLNNFLDSSYLADGETTIRTYLDNSGSNWREIDSAYHY
ncbi:gamma-glutamylcyclotransferase [Neptuniibacter sp. QD72_48]|uniref:gamma-glutamylcyclotransferase n=1 Tax=unclassified Neptuniibacter TaxID=2630693 RepID=UPI0039F5B24D